MKARKNRFGQDDGEEWIDWQAKEDENEEEDEEYARRLFRKEKRLRKRKKVSDLKQDEEGVAEGRQG
ncbi:MAG: hypothetical protein HYY65_08825 [Candidatus Tectomicrobia bacterium]|uniref:Uncharacterized protein n=1 Tax=Tectimicrobiota bacterium TaxID=2528274 RepID=A0A932M134_UNCTE|nr:hypothetical protein [Candidatus Tectomicrobia bacterium]